MCAPSDRQELAKFASDVPHRHSHHGLARIALRAAMARLRRCRHPTSDCRGLRAVAGHGDVGLALGHIRCAVDVSATGGPARAGSHTLFSSRDCTGTSSRTHWGVTGPGGNSAALRHTDRLLDPVSPIEIYPYTHQTKPNKRQHDQHQPLRYIVEFLFSV